MDTETYFDYYRALYLERLMAAPRFPPAFLLEDVTFQVLEDLIAPPVHQRLNVCAEEIEEKYGFHRRGGPASYRSRVATRGARGRLERLFDEVAGSLGLRVEVQKNLSQEKVGIEQKILRLIQTFQLNHEEGEVFRFFAFCTVDQTLKELLEDSTLEAMRRDYAAFVGRLVELPTARVRGIIGVGGRLAKMEVLENHEVVRSGRHPSELSEMVVQLLADESVTAGNIVEGFYTREPAPSLVLADFAHLKTEMEVVSRLLRDAWREKRPGTNILLYGAPGLGKTELARLVGRICKGNVYSISRKDDDGDTCTPSERRLSNQVFQRMCQGEKRPLLIVDEADDLLNEEVGFLFGPRQPRVDSKAWLTQVLVDNPLPVIWIVNHHCGIHDAVRRRMTYSVEFPGLNREVMMRVWESTLARTGEAFHLPQAEVEKLVSAFALSPGHITQAVDSWKRATGRGRPALRQLEHILGQSLTLATGERPGRARLRELDARYDPTLLQTDFDTEQLSAMVTRYYHLQRATPEVAPFQMTLLFHGPPGSGKTEFAKFLSRSSGRTLQVERASDLLSMWVGQSEQKIARAFARAADQGNILLIDEADSLIFDRQKTQKMWETSQVNQFLQELENYRGVLVAATNLIEHMDSAVARRFAYKIKFSGLRREKRVDAVEGYFAPLLPVGLNGDLRGQVMGFPSLFPGDLKAVRDALQPEILLGTSPDPKTLVEALRKEAGFRKGENRPIGFETKRLN